MRPATPEEIQAWALKDGSWQGATRYPPQVGDLGMRHPALQGLEGFFYDRPTNVGGWVSTKEPHSNRMYLNTGSSLYQSDPNMVKLHEADHLRSYRSGTSKDEHYMKNAGSFSGLHLTRRILDNLDLLEKKYPGITQVAYFDPKNKRPRDFDELMTELSARELSTGKFLTADPELRKALFDDDPQLMEAYNSMSNWRTTRWDARDPAPYKYRDDLVPSFFDTLVNKIKGK